MMLRGLHFLGLGLVLLISRPAACQGPTRPNILLIVADDMGYNDLGHLNSGIKTPHLDRLAAEGVRLTDFYVSWPACTPSRGSIVTGRYPQRNGLYDMIRNDMVNYGHQYTEVEYALSPEMTLGMDEREVMISVPLRQAGYATGVFGKWDGGRAKRFLPRQRGFDRFFGFANTGIDYYTHERYGIPSMFSDNDRVKVKGYSTDLFRDEAIRFIDAHKDRPFFLYLPFNAPHGASNLDHSGCQAPPEWIDQYELTEKTAKAEKQRVYRACVSCMDDAIGKVLARLESHKLTENTVVLFMSDNGGSGGADNGPLRGAKSSMWEGGLRVPCLAKWPNQYPAGRISRDFCTALDLFPTLIKLAQADRPAGVVLDGYDLNPVLRRKEPAARKEMFWERRLDQAARVGQWKWIRTPKTEGLYDLSQDIGESTNLAQNKPEILAHVRNRFEAWAKLMAECEPRGPFRDY